MLLLLLLFILLDDLPNYNGIEGTGQVHQCSKVPLAEKVFPSVRVPLSTTAWKFGSATCIKLCIIINYNHPLGMDKIYWPFYKNIMVGKQGNIIAIISLTSLVLLFK